MAATMDALDRFCVAEAAYSRLELVEAADQWKATEEAQRDAERAAEAAEGARTDEERREALQGQGMAMIEAYKAAKADAELEQRMAARDEAIAAKAVSV